MARRKNGGIIGPVNNTPESSFPSGMWTADEVNTIRERNKAPISSERLTRKSTWESQERDPYYPNVRVNVGDLEYSDWLLKDKSSNNWHEFLAMDAYQRFPVPHANGPRYSDWCTHFHEDSNLTVNDTGTVLAFGTGAFTIEFWIKLARQDGTQHYVMGRGLQAGTTAGTGWVVFIDATYKLGFYDASGDIKATTTTAMNRDQWYHVAIVRNSTATNDTKIYINGVAEATFTLATNMSQSNRWLVVGKDCTSTAATFFGGKLTDIRIVKGTAKYTSNFTTPTSALDMTGATYSLSMREYNNGANKYTQKQLTDVNIGTSCYRMIDSPFLDRSNILTGHCSSSVHLYNSAYLKIYDQKPSNTALQFGTGAFTIEAYVYLSNAGIGATASGIMGKGNGAINTGSGWDLYFNKTTYYQQLCFSAGTTVYTSANFNYTYNAWHHIAVVRESTATNGFKMYVDGALVYTGTLATNFTETDPLRLFATKSNDWVLRGNLSGLRISNNARYTTTNTTTGTVVFDPTTTTFMDALGTADSNTMLLMCTQGTGTPKSQAPTWYNKTVGGPPVHHKSNETRFGQHHPSNRGRGGSYFYGIINTSGLDKYVATSTQSDFDFGTGDFSIELWAMLRQEGSVRTLFDTRQYFTDSGIELRLNGNALIVTTNGKPILVEANAITGALLWTHICVQRTSGKMALYVNGKMTREVSFTSAITAPLGKMWLGNGAPDITNNSTWVGLLSDIRVLKGSAAYSQGTNNPETISLPKEPLKAITNTVLLTYNNPILADYSGRGNRVGWAKDDYPTGGYWDIYYTNVSPYAPAYDWDAEKEIFGDTSDTNAGFETLSTMTGNNTKPEHSYITRLSTPWTIECFIYPENQDPTTTPSNYINLYTGNTATHEGWCIRSSAGDSAGALINSYNNINFAMYTAHDGAVQYLSTTDTNPNTTLNNRCWNHVAVVYNPAATNKLAIFINGVRKAVTTSWNPGQKIWNTLGVTTSTVGTGGVRISKTARYNNDSTTPFTVPTSYTFDSYTDFTGQLVSPTPEKSLSQYMLSYGVMPSTEVKAFASSKGSMRFSNKETTLVDRINLDYGTYGARNLDTASNDFTFECWASVWDVASGGQAISTYRVLHHLFNDVQIRVDSNGYWVFLRGAVGTDYPSVVITTDVLAATKTSGRMDHIAYVRRGGNFYCYINGVEKAILWASNPGIYTTGSLGATNYYSVNFVSSSSFKGLRIGCDNSNTQATAWCGFVQDMRLSYIPRYTTKVINGVNTMVYEGTSIPALPTKIHPTR